MRPDPPPGPPGGLKHADHPIWTVIVDAATAGVTDGEQWLCIAAAAEILPHVSSTRAADELKKTLLRAQPPAVLANRQHQIRKRPGKKTVTCCKLTDLQRVASVEFFSTVYY